MHKLKVLWFSNRVLSNEDSATTGGWLHAMAQGLINSGEIVLGNISRGSVGQINRQDCGEINQWVIPYKSRFTTNSFTLSNNIIRDIVDTVKMYSPEVIHIWGTEDFWGLLTAKKYLRTPALLEMQGLKRSIARVFYGGLTMSERAACIGLKELIQRSTIATEYKKYLKWGEIEKEIISGHNYITIQTDWIKAQVNAINNDAHIFRSALLLRNVFYKTNPWKFPNNITIFCSSAYPSPFKGLHVAIRAAARLKEEYPQIQLNIAGFLQKPGIRQDGYIAWLNREIKKLKLGENVRWFGPLSSVQMVDAIRSSAVMVIPSYIENCSNLMQEGMMLGIPIVASFVGGLPSLARDEESALFFSPGDETMCAYQIKRLLTDQLLANNISRQAREIAGVRNNYQKIIENQINIYQHINNSSDVSNSLSE